MCELAGIDVDREGASGLEELVGNILRGSVSSVMYVILLFTLTKSRFSRKADIIVISSVFIIHTASTMWFYLFGNLTALSRFSVVLFILITIAIKPLTYLSFMQWIFTALTSLNIGMMIIILSFHLGRLFPDPLLAHTIIRLILYVFVIFSFKRYLLPSYQSVVTNWPIFSALVISIFFNLAYYFYFTDDIVASLASHRWQLLLLVALSLSAYGTVFYSLHKLTAMYELEVENLNIQKETGRLHETAMQLEKYANFDMLTGLPNRRYFFEKLKTLVEESKRDGRTFALLYIDLDGFKDINDACGHEVGDKVLKEVGNRLQQSVRETDFAARLGGDEFAMVILDSPDDTDVMKLAKRLQATLREGMDIEGLEHRIDASIGIATYPESGHDSETLVRHADAMMYTKKKEGKGSIGLFPN
jgi:diguanylate cyclase (GGDEF)-like protein